MAELPISAVLPTATPSFGFSITLPHFSLIPAGMDSNKACKQGGKDRGEHVL